MRDIFTFRELRLARRYISTYLFKVLQAGVGVALLYALRWLILQHADLLSIPAAFADGVFTALIFIIFPFVLVLLVLDPFLFALQAYTRGKHRKR